MDEEVGGEQVIEFFTALLIDYNLQDHKMRTTVWFETEGHCQEVMDRNIAEPLYNYLYTLYGNNMIMTCHVTEEVSHELVRPKLRPKDLK